MKKIILITLVFGFNFNACINDEGACYPWIPSFVPNQDDCGIEKDTLEQIPLLNNNGNSNQNIFNNIVYKFQNNEYKNEYNISLGCGDFIKNFLNWLLA